MPTARVRRWFIRLGVVGIVVAGLAVAAALALRAYAPTLSREAVEAALTERLGRSVAIGSLTVSPWLARAEVRDVRIEAGPGEGTEPMLRLGRGALQVGVSSVWRREIVVSRIVLEDLALRLTAGRQEAGPPALDIPETLDLGPVTVRIGTVRVERGNVVYRDANGNLDVTVRSLHATARPIQRGIDADLRVGSVSVRTPDVDETFAELEAAVRLRPDRLAMRRVTVRWNERQIAVTGDVHHPFTAPDAALRVRAQLDLAEVAQRVELPWPVAGVAAVEADVRGRLDAPEISGRLTVPRLTAAFIHARTVVIRGSWGPGGLAAHLQGEVDLAPIGREFLPQSEWPVAGVAAVEADVRGRLDAPEISGRLTVPRLTAGAAQAQDVAVRARWGEGVLRVPEISARIVGGTLRGSLQVRPDALEATQISVALEKGSLAALASLLPLPDGVRGELTLETALEGDPHRLEAVQGRFRLTASGLVPPGDLSRIGPGTLAIAGTFRNEIAELTQASGRWPGLHFEAAGPVGHQGPMGLRLTAEADVGRAASLWGVTGVAGQATVTGNATGRWDAPEVVGEVRAAPITIADVTLDSLRVPYQLDATRLAVQAATAALGKSRADLSGTMTWHDGAERADAPRGIRFRADVRAPSLHWEDLHPWLPPAAQGAGRVGLVGHVEGGRDAWSAEGSVEAAVLTVRDVPIRDLRGAFAATQSGIDVSQLRAGVHGIPVAATGAFGWDGSGKATADVGPADLAALTVLPRAVGLQGTGQAHVQLVTKAGAVELSGRVALDRLATADIQLGGGTGQFDLRDNRLEATVTLPDAGLSATVRGPVDGPQPLAVRVDAQDVALAPLLAGVDRLRDMDVGGTVTASVEAFVPLAQPSAARGTLTVTSARLRVAGDEWTNRGPATLRWEADRLTIEAVRVTSRLGDLRVEGRVDPWGPINVQVDGRFPLDLLSALRPEIREAAGTLAVTGRIEGTATAPRPTGEATVRAGTLQLRDRPEILRDIEGRILFSQKSLRLEEATATLGRGKVRASGELTLNGWQPGAYRIAASGRNVSVAPVEGLQTAWDLDLELVGQGERRLLRGEGRLLQGRYTGRLNLVAMLLSGQAEPAAEASSALPMHIVLQLDNNLRVDTNWARLQVGGRLSLEGTTARPIVLGSLESQEGRITFRKHRWTVTSAAVRFADPRRIEPILDVTGRAQIQQYDVTLHLSGRLDEITFRFSSVPPLQQQELLSLVTAGTTSVTAGAALGEVGQLLAEDVLGVATGGYAPETFGVEETQNKEKVFNVGKQLTEDVRVVYSQSLSGAAKRVLRVEYQVLGPLFLAGEQDFQGGFGGDILIRLRFR